MSRDRGSVIVLALLLCSLMFILGIAFLSKRSSQFQSVKQTQLAAQALQIAWSGLEHTRVKLDKDYHFPPVGDEQRRFSFSEDVFTTQGEVAGSYTATVDSTWAKGPHYLLRVTITGRVGPEARTNPAARRTLRAEFDLSPQDRSNPSSPNPRLFQMISLEDEGGP